MKKFLAICTALLLLASTCYSQVFSCPPNLDFEQGNYSNWQFYTGTCCPVSANTLSGPIANRHTLTTGPGLDPYGNFPVVYPGGGNYSLKLGNSGTGSQAEKARYTFTIPPGLNNYSLIYSYAVVLQDPSHTPSEQPRFDVKVYNAATNQILPCANYSYVASANLPGFQSNGNVRFKPWSTASINLSGYAGQTLIAEFASGDCGLGAHFGYGYIDLACGLFQVSAVNCNNAPTMTFNGPPGFANYSWYNTNFSASYGTGQNLTIPTPPNNSIINLVITPYIGFGCPDTLQTLVNVSNFASTLPDSITICEFDTATVAANVIGNSLSYTYQWSPGVGISCTNCDTTHISPPNSQYYYLQITDQYGCTLMDTTFIAVNEVSINQISDSICQPGSLYGYSNSGIYVDTFTSASGCDSIRILDLTVHPISTSLTTQSICQGDTLWGYFQAGLYSDTLINSNGCDSIRTLNLSVIPVTYSQIMDTICEPNSVFGYTQSGTYVDTLVNSSGCDSVRTLVLLVHPITDTVISDTICQPNSLYGYSVTGVFVDTFMNQYACDSIRTIHLTVHPITFSSIQQAICQGDTFLGYTASGVYVDTISNNYGCDSIRTLNLSVIPITSSQTSDTICEPNSVFGYSQSGTYIDTLVNSSGCDSIRTLVLLVYPISDTVISDTICQPNSLYGYSLTGVYVDTFLNQYACDSIRTIQLTVHPMTFSSIQQTICQGDTFLGYTVSGLYVDTIANNYGCDSIRTLNLVVNQTTYSSLTDTICEPYTVYGYGQSGIYVDTLTNYQGCDSIRTLSLTVNPRNFIQINQTICQGDSFYQYTQSGVYLDTFINKSGCDSIRTINLQVTPTTFSFFRDSVCFGESFMGYSTTGIFIDTFISIAGCDSIRSVDLFINQMILYPALDSVQCVGESDGKLKVNVQGGFPPFTYALKPGLHINTSGHFFGLPAGIYSLSVRDQFVCTTDTVIEIKQSAEPLELNFAKKDLPCFGTGFDGWAEVQASGGLPPYSILWHTTPPSTQSRIENLSFGKYKVTVIDANGCDIIDSVYLNGSNCCDNLFLPNAFTPNKDGFNDLFRMITTAEIELYEFAIYNRWGNRIWSTSNFREGWDGTLKGTPQPIGTYFYILKYKCKFDEQDHFLKGDITLLR